MGVRMKAMLAASVLVVAALGRAAVAADAVEKKADDRAWAQAVAAKKVTPADIAATYPKAAFDKKISGGAVLDCTANEAGEEVDCRVLEEDPVGMGFGEAALKLVTKERVKTKDASGASIVGRRFKSGFSYLAPGDANPDWVKKPGAAELAGVFPRFKAGKGVDGQARITCRIDEAGFLQRCVVVSEEPAGVGFGAAALQLAPQFRMSPKIRGGKAVPGGEVTIPINWKGFGDYHPDPHSQSSLVLDPPWDSTPTFEQVRAAWPSTAKDAATGQVALRCKLNKTGGLSDCDTISEIPTGRGFAKAARSLTGAFKVHFNPDQAKSLDTYKVDVPFRFRAPATPDARKIGAPNWIRMLTAEGMAAAYPQAARQAGIKTGLGVVNCVVDVKGALRDCEVRREDPAGLDFGAAAMEAIKPMAINPWSKEGEPLDGLRISVPIRFVWDETSPPAAPPAKP